MRNPDNGYRQFPQSEPSMMHEPMSTAIPREDSMEISNDPRFFTDSVIDKRLAAFGSLVVVSALMLEYAATEGMGMKKNMGLDSVESVFQLLAFIIYMAIFIATAFTTYVSVAQPYHTLRLATAGPAGFEASASYYLHGSIIIWRHLAVKCLLVCIPWFVLASGLRMVPKFVWDAVSDESVIKHRIDTAAGDDDGHKHESLSFGSSWLQYTEVILYVESGVFALAFLASALALYLIHLEHQKVFQENYDNIFYGTGMSNMLTEIRGNMHRRTGIRAGPLDV
jgi:hypothetical protein